MRHPKDVSRNVALKSNTHLTEQIHSAAHDYIAPNKNNRDKKKPKPNGLGVKRYWQTAYQ